MTALAPQFTIDVYNASGGLVGPGPLYNIISITHEEALDLAGRVEVVVPARKNNTHHKRSKGRLLISKQNLG